MGSALKSRVVGRTVSLHYCCAIELVGELIAVTVITVHDYGDRCENPQTHSAARANNANAALTFGPLRDGSASTIPSSVRAVALGDASTGSA